MGIALSSKLSIGLLLDNQIEEWQLDSGGVRRESSLHLYFQLAAKNQLFDTPCSTSTTTQE